MSVKTRLVGWSVIVGILLGCAATAVAQAVSEPSDPQVAGAAESAGGIGGMGGVGLLRSDQVQAELKLTDQQRTQIEEFLDGIRTELRSRIDQLRSFTGEELRKKAEELEAQFKQEAPQRALRIHREIEAILQPEQLKRFRQLQLRSEGPWTLLRPDVVEALAMTDAQKEHIERVSRETQQKMREVFREARQSELGEPTKDGQSSRMDQLRRLGAQVEKVRQEGQKQAASVLTRPQAEKLLELMGEPLGSRLPPFSPRLGGDRKIPDKQTPETRPPDATASQSEPGQPSVPKTNP